MNTYVDPNGVENVAVGIIKQAKKDFIKGAKILYKFFKRIPEEVEVLLDRNHKTLANNRDVRLTYDSWRFVKKDPYFMFDDIGEKTIIESWKLDSIVSYYQDLYINGAIIAYQSGFEKKKKDLYELSRSTLEKKYIKDTNILDQFIEARDYISKLSDALNHFNEWNAIAYERAKIRIRKGLGRDYIAKKRKEEREEKKLKAFDLRESGMSVSEIAKSLGVGKTCVYRYFRELDSK